jgi:polysaccharide export outer membrane protein
LGGLTINGEIASPGTKRYFKSKSLSWRLFVNAGDITITGDRKAVTVMKNTYWSCYARFRPYRYQCNEIPFYYLQPNDYIYIKPLKQKSWGLERP